MNCLLQTTLLCVSTYNFQKRTMANRTVQWFIWLSSADIATNPTQLSVQLVEQLSLLGMPKPQGFEGDTPDSYCAKQQVSSTTMCRMWTICPARPFHHKRQKKRHFGARV